jgi:DNA-binding GntR family transcriptional regulator
MAARRSRLHPNVAMKTSVYQQLKTAIVEGELPAGQSLVETALADHYGVSRTPVREALHRLQQDGLVERADRGLRVVEGSAERILEIYEVRVVLEAAACAAAARRHTDVDLARLRGVMEGTPAESAEAAEKAVWNHQFHEAVWQATHNTTLVDLLTRLEVHLRRYPATTLVYPGRWDEAIAEHAELLDAIAASDQERAQEVGRRHMTRARDIRLRMWQDEQQRAGTEALAAS